MRLTQWYRVGPAGAVVDCATMTDDGELITAVVVGRVILLRDGRQFPLPERISTERYAAAAVAPHGQYLALASSVLRIVDLYSQEIHDVPVDGICHLSWQRDGQQLATSHTRNVLNQWSSVGAHVGSLTLPVKRKHWWVASDPGQAFLFAASYDIPPNSICVGSLDGPVIKAALAQDRSVSGLVTWRDRAIIATTDASSHFELMAYSPRLDLIKQVSLKASITALAACPDGDWLVAGTVNGNIWVLDAETLQVTDRCTLWAAPVRTVAASAQESVLAGASDGQLALLELI